MSSLALVAETVAADGFIQDVDLDQTSLSYSFFFVFEIVSQRICNGFFIYIYFFTRGIDNWGLGWYSCDMESKDPILPPLYP